tara:strand:- start:1528 stop:2256 length:729 start_codon:yes stop_codon:yes gene_type:complete
MIKKLFHRILQLIEEEKGGAFIVMFTSLSVILLAFFVLLNSMATIDEKKVTRAVKSIRGSFGVLSSDIRWLMGTKPKLSSEFEILAIKELEVHSLSRELENFIMRKEMGKDFGFFTSKEGTIISLSEKVGFSPGKAELEPPMLPILNKIAELIKRTGKTVHIEGHTDNIPIKTKKYQSNWDLSTARAVNILKYFVEKRGIDPTKIAATGFGDVRPLFLNDTSLNRSHNRRVDIVILDNKIEL